MKVLTNSFSHKADPIELLRLVSYYSKKADSLENFVFFDIETTGFSPKNSMCYLIGAVFFENGQLTMTQWFADTPDSETALLRSFLTFLSDFQCMIHFNGDHFDIPFLRERCQLLEVNDALMTSLTDCESIDVFKLIKSCHSLLTLDNYKQKTLEQFLGIHRQDQYNGGELIAIYKDYVISHEKTAEELLLLHNRDDICGLYAIFPAVSYRRIYDGAFSIQSCEINEAVNYEGTLQKELLLTGQLDTPFPTAVSIQKGICRIWLKEYTLRFQIPLFEGELKLFYPDYKNYYYLPEEDCAMHKSVASYVDKNHREQAKAATCYTKVQGLFLPGYNSTTPVLKTAYSDSVFWTKLEESFLQHADMQLSYIKEILKTIL